MTKPTLKVSWGDGSFFVEGTPATHLNFGQHLIGWYMRRDSGGATINQICEIICGKD